MVIENRSIDFLKTMLYAEGREQYVPAFVVSVKVCYSYISGGWGNEFY